METKLKFSIRLNLVLMIMVVTLLIIQFLMLQSTNDTTVVVENQSNASELTKVELAGCTATVHVRQLNQRSGPGESFSVIGSARNGEVMIGTGWDASHTWLLVSSTDGLAWMYAPYMSLSADCDNLPVSSSTEIMVQTIASPTPSASINQASGENTTPRLSSVFTPEVQYWAENILAWAEAYQMDPNLIATVIQIESCGDPTVSSGAGAQGLFQVMPFHFEAGEDMLDVETNARRGLDYLQGALALANGDVGLALVGYNGGYGVINGGWTTETQHYYYWGSRIYTEASSGATVSSTLEEWLTAGGSNLCARASQNLQLL